MNRRVFLQKVALGAAALSASSPAKGFEAQKPNIIFIMADDMGYGDLGCYGQKKFRTPNIDRIAAEGMRFTDCYAGSTVCAPSRSVLMTGQHTGHTRVRGNMCRAGGTVGYKGSRKVRRMNLTDRDQTVGHVLQRAGYRTGIIGKWHLGGYDENAGPLDRGFDEFYGWLTRTSETINPTYYPTKRYRNRQLYDIAENQNGKSGYYHTDICTDEAVAFLKNNHKRPFFLYLAYINPHDPLVVPDLGPYADKDWPEPMKTYAAMIHRLDESIGRIMSLLKELRIDENTIVFFCSDNGPRSGGSRTLTEVAEFFNSNGPFTGYKRDMNEGGIRVPMIARWPGKVGAGKVNSTPWYFADVLPTIADIAKAKTPAKIDGISMLATLLSESQETSERFLYWEFFERGFQQAIRWKNYKAIRLKTDQPLLLFDLSKDPAESNDIAKQHPEVIATIGNYLKTARTDSPNWPI
jgi:arylsulfatase A-like enzyme